jgi:hypothetical protein
MNIKRYIALAKGSPICITAVEGTQFENQQTLKEEWLRTGRSILRKLAKELGLVEGSYDIRINRGGCAVSGDVILHGEWIYVDLSQTCLGPDYGFMWRFCDGRKDYRGKANQWSKWESLLDLPKLAGIMKGERS